METVLSQLDASEIAECTGGRLAYGSGSAEFSGVSIDTRTLQSKELFFAIRGPNHDGHAFIPKALSAGASGIIAEAEYVHPEEFPSNRVLVRVEDTHQALKDLAAAVRCKWRGTSIGLTGSIGKTTTKEFVAQILQDSYGVYRSPGNYNNLYGLPLAIFGLRTADSFGIFEMGMSAPGEIAEMCRIAEPNIGVITTVAPVHLEFFNSVEEIADAKAELAEALPANGVLVYNCDNRFVRTIAARFGGRKISFGSGDEADYRADRIELAGVAETRFRLHWKGFEKIATIPLAGAHYVMNALPAVVLGHLYGIAPENIIETLRRLQPSSMRGRILNFRNGFTVIDDSYNSNPEALKSMIGVLSRLPSFKRRILITGEMLELGDDSESLHYECGIFAAEAELDVIIGVRGAARETVRAAIENGMGEKQALFFPGVEEASEFIQGEIRDGDLILIKGSRGVRMETIIRKLRDVYDCTGA